MLAFLFACASDLPRDVLVVTLDTARADRFGFLGGAVPTPAVDAVAAEGIAYTQAVAPAPITLVSHATLFTGLDPAAHGVRNNGTYTLPDVHETLAERMRTTGRATGAFVGAAVLDHRYGLHQGFDVYDDTIPAGTGFAYARRPGEEVVSAALAWLDTQPGPTFAWVHLFDAHAPYPGGGYDEGIATLDRHVGALLEGYRARGRYDDALVVITADHGESLGEHGETTHGVFVYDATVRVPLVVRAPGVTPRRESQQVGLADVMPLMLAHLEGRPISPTERILPLESVLPYQNYGWAPVRGLRTSTRKAVLAVQAESYDLGADPGETRDLGEAGAPDLVGRLRAEPLEGLLTPAPGTADAATRQQLEALGYVEVDAPAAGPLPDPRTHIVEGEQMSEAASAMARGDMQAALAGMRALVQANPANRLAWARLGAMAWQASDFAEAARAYGEAAARTPTDPSLRENQGAALERLGDVDAALAAYDAANARPRAWALLARAGRLETLRQEAAAHPDDADLAVFLAETALTAGDSAAAEPHLRRALAASPGHAKATLHLARILLLRGLPAEAALLARAADPSALPALHLVRAEAFGRLGDWSAARVSADAALAALPDRADSWTLSGWIHLQAGDTPRARADLERAQAMGSRHPLHADAWAASR